ncbi:flagellar assembly protein FliW [Oscillospiraceae bacterium PP1C4]
MELMTRDFGVVEIDESDIITFKQPVYGFETLTKYVILYDQSASTRFVWMQSVEDENICFILVEPEAVIQNYSPELPPNIIKMLGEGDFMFWLVVVIADQFKNSTVNLKSPIVVNAQQRSAAQVILEEDRPIRYPLVPHRKENESHADII